jgi:GntR family transcriptional regulator/MocR family aminotransferase
LQQYNAPLDFESNETDKGDRATEAAIATLIEDGELQRHVARVRRVYANRREILANSLRRTFGDQVEFTLAPGGMAVWVRLLGSVDVEAWARRSVQHGVAWYPGRRYSGKSFEVTFVAIPGVTSTR